VIVFNAIWGSMAHEKDFSELRLPNMPFAIYLILPGAAQLGNITWCGVFTEDG